jgi:hypothetical protein
VIGGLAYGNGRFVAFSTARGGGLVTEPRTILSSVDGENS